MDTQSALFSLLRLAVCDDVPTEQLKTACTESMLEAVYALASRHDLAHLVGQAVSKLDLPDSEILSKCKQSAMQALMRYMQLNYEYERVCQALEEAQILFIPLKGAVLRAYYPEPWMRTSCDVDILVPGQDLERAISGLQEELGYILKDRSTHDVVLDSPSGVHMELHYDLVEEGRANNAIQVLSTVWQDAKPCRDRQFFHKMSDPFFYFYHIAHMAKHFENGGCGIRPFLDLWILDLMESADQEKRNALLEKGGLKRFADVCRKLSRVWFGREQADDLSLQMQAFLLHGGAYGTIDNRVALQQKKQGGRLGYLWSRVFAPREKLERYYPILKKHRALLPFMQIRRWCMLLRPSVAGMAKRELQVNKTVNTESAEEMQIFLNNMGL